MNRIFTLLFFMLIVCVSEGSYAQVGTLNAIPQNISPEAAMLGKFVEVPVSNYSGLPEVGVPVYNFKAKTLSVPISLAYHASGVKVADIPGWVGANWALQAGGMITRVVRGLPDKNYGDNDYYKRNAALLGTPGYNWPNPKWMPNIEALGTKVDTEYDLYYFNFMGHTGRFTYDNTGQLLMLEANDIKVSPATKFIFTDGDGVEYQFNDIEYHQWPNDVPYACAWYLSKITVPHQQETINFSYQKYTNNMQLYRSGYGPESFYEKTLFRDFFPPEPSYGIYENPDCESGGYVSHAELQLGETCVLKKIAYQSDSIRFYHDTSRADLYKVRLDSIRVFQGASPVHSTRFTYAFSNSSSTNWQDKKMLLSGVQSNDQPAYAFSYYGSFNGKSLPGPYIHGSDLWGYYNGGSYTIYTPVTDPHHPDYRYGQIGSLQSITYPTGGNTEFTYEGNDFSYCQNELDSVGPVYQAGGLRIKKIKFNSPVSSSSFEKNYTYTYNSKSSGVLEAPFANKTAMFHWGEGRPVGSPYCGSATWPQICSFYAVHHDNVIPLGNAQGGAIGYAQVTETLGDGSKKVMQYSNGGMDWPTMDPLFDGWADGYSNFYLGDNLIQDRLFYDYSAYRGKLKKAAYYNSGGQKIKEELHKFTDLIDTRLSFSQQQKSQNFYAVLMNSIYLNICASPPDYGISWGIYFNVQRNMVPTRDEFYTFKGTDTLKEVTKYEYNSPLRILASRIIHINPQGDSTFTQYRYPYDITVAGSSTYAVAINNLKTKNVIHQPVETYVMKKDAGGGNVRTTDAQLVAFKTNRAVPETVYRISNTAGLNDFAPLTLSAGGATTDSRYIPSLRFYNYDGFGNVSEQGKEGAAKEVLVWGYQHRLIVARISSSSYAAVIALVDTNVVNNPSSDVALRTELAKIRTGLATANPKAKVTSYTYATLKGMTSMTDPRGETTFYEYDPYGRLKRRKDANGDSKANISYHYKP